VIWLAVSWDISEVTGKVVLWLLSSLLLSSSLSLVPEVRFGFVGADLKEELGRLT